MKSRFNFTVAMLVLLPLLASAQITITPNDLSGLAGKTQIYEEDVSGSLMVNVGSAGANQVWDFSNLVLEAESRTQQFIAPQGTPFAPRFPQANLALKLNNNGDPSVAYLYVQIANADFRMLGSGVVGPDTSLASNFGNDAMTPLPLQMNRTWNSVQKDTLGLLEEFAFVTDFKSANQVDAWGTVRLPNGDYDCLRIRSNNTTVTKTYFTGELFMTDSSSSISYSWISKNDFIVTTITSQDGETNPNFTDAAEFERLVSSSTGVAERDNNSTMPSGFTLEQNFPNPFNPETQIAFQLHRDGFVELKVYTLLGKEVRTLISAPMSAGSHRVEWNGRDEHGNSLASGIYLYRLKAGGVAQMKRMALVR